MKTAGKLFLDWYNDYVSKRGCSPSDYDVNFYWTGANLETEKQQLLFFYDSGVSATVSSEQFYEQTFKNK